MKSRRSGEKRRGCIFFFCLTGKVRADLVEHERERCLARRLSRFPFPRRNGCEGRVEQAVAAGEAPRERAPPEAEAPGDGSVRWGPRMGRIAAAVLAAWGAPPTSG